MMASAASLMDASLQLFWEELEDELQPPPLLVRVLSNSMLVGGQSSSQVPGGGGSGGAGLVVSAFVAEWGFKWARVGPLDAE